VLHVLLLRHQRVLGAGLHLSQLSHFRGPAQYGKFAFATNVIERNANTISFSGFAPLLDRIVAVLDHYALLKAAPLAAAC
jgi:hypothetical protein